MPRSRLKTSMRGLVAGVILIAAASCGQKKPERSHERYVLACGPEDQHASYLNPINARQVVKIRYDAGFTNTEVKDIHQAVAAWNQYSISTRSNRLLFEIEESVSTTSVPGGNGDCDFPASSDGYGIVLVTDTNVWKSFGLSENNPAVTVRCSRGREYVAKQVVLVNAKIIREGSGAGLFQTIMKHEIGHSIGVDHSCDLSESVHPQFVGCSKAVDVPEYFEAVMWPFIRTEYPNLSVNDDTRASCILGESA